MTYLVAFEGKLGMQTHRGSRLYRTAAKSIKEAHKLAEQGYSVSAMKITPAGNLDSILFTTKTN